MSCTNLTHGCTLSYARLCVVPKSMHWRNIKNMLWDELDAALISGTADTIQGPTPEKHVFKNKMPGWNADLMSTKMKNVL
jgi:hypothetical protein